MMMEATARISELIFKYLNEELSREEQLELKAWKSQHPEYEQLFTELVSPERIREGIRSVYAIQEAKKRIYERVLDSFLRQQEEIATPVRQMNFFRRYRWAAAASILVMVSIGAYLLFSGRGLRNTIAKVSEQFKTDVPPGGNKAMLILANGKTIILDSTHNGMIASQGNSRVMKIGNGLLAYNQQQTNSSVPGQAQNSKLTALQYNTLTTPRGGQYQVVLPDGSKVWLNAESSIHYPTVFTGKERMVEITGEAYFEVAANPSIPFIVKKGTAEVQVLGTHFNMNAYDDESSMKVTLLEGSVRVTSSNSQLPTPNSQLLIPGQQARVSNDGQIMLVKNANTEEAAAWKNGEFRFDSADIQSIMRELARWYDVDVQYKGEVRETFSGGISRDVNISQVLKILEYSNKVSFEIEGKKIIVEPK